MPDAVSGQRTSNVAVPAEVQLQLDSLLAAGEQIYDNREYGDALNVFEEAEELALSFAPSASLLRSQIWQVWSLIYLKQWSACPEILEKVEEQRRLYHPQNDSVHYELCRVQEKYFDRIDEHSRSYYYSKAGRVLLLGLEVDSSDWGAAYNREGKAAMKLGLFREAERAFAEAASFFGSGKAAQAVKNNRIAALNELGLRDSVLLLSQQLLDERLEFYNSELNIHVLVSYHNFAGHLFEDGQLDRAWEMNSIYLEYLPQVNSSRYNLARAYLLCAKILLQREEAEEALLALIQAQSLYTSEEIPVSFFEERFTLEFQFQIPEWVEIMDLKAQAYSLMNNAPRCYEETQMALDLIDTLRLRYADVLSREFFAAQIQPVLRRSADRLSSPLLSRFFDADLIWDISEQGKYWNLLLGKVERRFLQSRYDGGRQLDDWYQLEDALSGNFRKLKRARSQNSSTDLRKLELERLELLAKRQEIQEELFGALKTNDLDIEIPDPELIQANLKNGELYCSFFEGSENAFVFLMTSDWDSLLVINDLQGIRGFIYDSYLPSLREPAFFEENWKYSRASLAEYGYDLFELLFSAVSEFDRFKSITFVPDGFFHFLPLEVLLTEQINSEQKSFNDWPWLGNLCNIRYIHNSRLFLDADQRGLENASDVGEILVIKPDYGEDENWADLNHADRELRALRRYYSKVKQGQLLSSSSSDLKNWEGKALIHLAMHAEADSIDPLASRLIVPSTEAGADPHVYASDLYPLQLESSLVVLSACNSAYGPYLQGEGLHSLGRAFYQAGSEALVGSLWPVDDQAGSMIIEQFYRHLAEGRTFAESLRQSRMDYLHKTRTDEQLAHPFYWSEYILIGNNQPFPTNRPKRWPWLLLGLLPMIVIVYRFIKPVPNSTRV